MYHLEDEVSKILGVGPVIAKQLNSAKIYKIKDLLLFLPYRYEDRTRKLMISELESVARSPEKLLFTIEATVISSRSNFFRGRSMQTAKLIDESGTITASWFNNPFIVKRLKQQQTYLFSGQIATSKKNQLYLTQPIVEDINKESIHTNRLVPIYSTIKGIAPTTLRKIQKQLIDHLAEITDAVTEYNQISLTAAIKVLHFPEQIDTVVAARERLAVEELILLISHSLKLKEAWKKNKATITTRDSDFVIPRTIPFALTNSQQRCVTEILQDLTNNHPMNRLLIGDVGSGKTIVAGLAMQKMISSGHHAALIAPTQILAEQHSKTLQKYFPKTPIYFITGKSKVQPQTPGFIIGTHAVLNIIKNWNVSNLVDSKPNHSVKQVEFAKSIIGLVVFDEQHRFGVAQRSELEHRGINPHLLTMTATLIPRSLLLTIFSHLQLSTIDELPKNRVPTKTWLVPETKRDSLYQWITDQILTGQKNKQKFQVLIVCPFINPSESAALENVAAAKDMFVAVRSKLITTSKLPITVGLLHSKLKKTEKETIISELFSGKIDVLVSTPIVEVGVDLPQASAMIIEAAERFGLASLHQLRGRVGRAGQQGYCILFTQSNSRITKERLKKFEKIHSGQELAELDLHNRGAGDLFGTQQSGFDQLQFANWTELELISKAKKIVDIYSSNKQEYISPLLSFTTNKEVHAN